VKVDHGGDAKLVCVPDHRRPASTCPERGAGRASVVDGDVAETTGQDLDGSLALAELVVVGGGVGLDGIEDGGNGQRDLKPGQGSLRLRARLSESRGGEEGGASEGDELTTTGLRAHSGPGSSDSEGLVQQAQSVLPEQVGGEGGEGK